MKLVNIQNDRAVSVREYKSTTATTGKTLDFRGYSEHYGLTYGSPEHRAEFSRYCNAENVKAVAGLEKFRASGLVLEKIVETTNKADGSLKSGVIRFSVPKVPKEKEKKATLPKGVENLPADKRATFIELWNLAHAEPIEV